MREIGAAAREEPENHSRTLPYKSAIAEEFLKNFKFARPIVTSASQLLHTSTRVRDGKHIRSSAQELLICTRTNYHPFPIVFLKENDSKNRDFREKRNCKKSMNSYFFSWGNPRSRPGLAYPTENCMEKAKNSIEKLDPKSKNSTSIR